MHYERVEWFPDGERLLIIGNEPGRLSRTFEQNKNGGKPTPITLEGTIATRVSPDQQFATVAKSGKLYLFPLAGGELKPIADLEPRETAIRWSADGRFLFLSRVTEPSVLMISRLDVNTHGKEPWKELKTPDPVGVQIREAVITPDGDAYAYSYQRDIATLYLADGLR
jgi:Tol biopolymer transport system component